MPTYAGIERRRHPRHKVLKAGKVFTPNKKSAIAVIITDMSVSGTRFTAPSTTTLPDTFELVFVAEGLLYPARVCWQQNALVGVEFIGEARLLDWAR